MKGVRGGLDEVAGTGWTTLGSAGNRKNQFDYPQGIFVR